MDVSCVDINYLKIKFPIKSCASAELLKEVTNTEVTAVLGLAQSFFVGVNVISPQFVFLSSSATHTRIMI